LISDRYALTLALDISILVAQFPVHKLCFGSHYLNFRCIYSERSMYSTGPVLVGKEVIYAHYSVEKTDVIVRISGDESDRLDLFEGKQINFGYPGQEPRSTHLMSLVPDPPFVWVKMSLAGGGR
jgi:hypothetical protein